MYITAVTEKLAQMYQCG